jgi:hypothetical protein
MATDSSTLWAPRHTTRVFDYEALPGLVDDSMKVLRQLKRRLKFNTIAVSGHSGLILGALVAQKLKMPLLAVRKPGDTCLDTRKVNGTRLKNCRYLVLDDLIDTGSTFKRIVTEIDNAFKAETRDRKRSKPLPNTLDELDPDYGEPLPRPKCVGALLFESLEHWETRTEHEDPLDVTKTISLFHLGPLTKHGGLL